MTPQEAKKKIIDLFREIEDAGISVNLNGGCGEAPHVQVGTWRDYEEIHDYDY